MKSGIELKYRDDSVNPADDLFRHVNGRWLDETPIPPDRARHGEFYILNDQAEANVRAIIESLDPDEHSPDSDFFKVATLYQDFMNVERVEAAGTSPIRAELDAVLGATTWGSWAEQCGRLDRQGLGRAPFGIWIDSDPDDPEAYCANVAQGGLGLPDESYYRLQQFAAVRSEYRAHLVRLATIFNCPDPATVAEAAWACESALAEHHWTREDSRDVSKTHNPMSLDALQQLAPAFPWGQWLPANRIPTDMTRVIVRQPSFWSGLSATLDSLGVEAWRCWLAVRIMHASAPLLSSDAVDENFAFYGRTLTGSEQLRDRWKRGVGLVEGVLGEAVGKAYVQHHFPPSSKAHMQRIVDWIVKAYAADIGQLDWMTDPTRRKALEKLGAFTPKIGYPDQWKDYSALEIIPGDLIGNCARAHEWEHDREIAKLGRPVDRSEWFMLPQTVNAYYNPGMNEIVFPAAILQPPFFDPEADDAVNFGGIGAVISHEISHGFDDQGSKYDGSGRLHNWWTDQDRQEFEDRARRLIEQFNGYESIDAPGHRVNGALTVGENIGDLGGLAVALKAYAMSCGNNPPPVIDGLTGVQRVFFGWAQVWRGKSREAEAIRLLNIDPHSPHDIRCNATVRNIPEFYEAFSVNPENALWLSPEDRVQIW